MTTRRTIRVTVVSLLAAAASFSADEAPLAGFGEEIVVLGEAPFVLPIEAETPVEIRFAVGEVEITTTRTDELRADLVVRCDEGLRPALCDKYRRRLRLEPRPRTDRIEVRLVGLPRWKLRKLHLEGTVAVPASSPLTVRIGVGDVQIHTAGQDLAVRMGIGDLDVHVPERSVGDVEIATRIGDASLSDGISTQEGGRRLLLGSRLSWHDGSGDGTVSVALKIGDATVRLE